MRRALGSVTLLVAETIAVSACGSSDRIEPSATAGGAPVTIVVSADEMLSAEAREDAWHGALACEWVSVLSPETVDHVRFTPIGNGKSVSGVMVSLFYPRAIVVPAGTPMLEAVGEAESGMGSRKVTRSTRDQTLTAVMIAVVDGTCTYAAPLQEPIATYERSGAEAFDVYR